LPFRLIDTRNLSHEQGLYTLCESLIGFHELFYRMGPFAVDDTLIGYNHKGHVRVWYNNEFAKNHFRQNSVVLMSTVTPHDFDKKLSSRMEADMVEDIWNSVDQHALFHGAFRDQVYALESLNFYNLRELIDDEIRRCSYVPAHLNLEDRFGIVSTSQAMLSDIGSRRSLNSQGRMRTVDMRRGTGYSNSSNTLNNNTLNNRTSLANQLN
jgi:hypothetical protein